MNTNKIYVNCQEDAERLHREGKLNNNNQPVDNSPYIISSYSNRKDSNNKDKQTIILNGKKVVGTKTNDATLDLNSGDNRTGEQIGDFLLRNIKY